MRLLLATLFALILISPTMVFANAQTGTCAGGSVGADTTGVFMQNICKECWDSGDCSLTDILTVVANVSNFILSIVGVLVFIYYIAGGFCWIISRGDQGMVTKGKKMIKNATIGLVIVLVAYTAVVVLRTAIMGQGISPGYVLCSGPATEGQACALNSTCSGLTCLTKEE